MRRLPARVAVLGCIALAASVMSLPVAKVAGAAVPPPGTGDLAAGENHTCSLTSQGGVKCWGVNTEGELGDGTTTNRSLPGFVSGLTSGVVAVSLGELFSCALTSAGGVKCWGWNPYGQLGDGTTTDRLTPVDVVGLSSGVSQIWAGGDNACALTIGGGVKCWGENGVGQVGDGTITNRNTPVDVVGLSSGVAKLSQSGGFFRTCALTTAGGVKCWGYNIYGQLGDGTTTNRSTPVNVSGLTSGVAAIAMGAIHSCALTTAGGVKCWGANNNGQLGDGTTTNRSTPVGVTGLTSGVARLGAGGLHTCALTTEGGEKCWGRNVTGQLGDGTTTNRSAPVDVTGLTSGVIALGDVNGDYSCAYTSALGLKCWGDNHLGQLGDGTSVDRHVPVDVSGSFFRSECPTLLATPHTSFVLSDGYAIGSLATFRADTGFDLIGSPTLACQTDQTWSGPPPTSKATNPTVVPGVGSVTEGDSGTTDLHVPVTLSSTSARTVTVPWRTSFGADGPTNQADPATDYTAASGTVTFAPGETTKTVTIAVNGDTMVEPDEFIVLSFHDPTNANMGGYWGLGVGVITNDDHATVVPGSGIVAAPATGTADLVVPVTLSNPSTSSVTVHWSTLFVPSSPTDPWLGPQAPTSDYVASSGTVTFAPGQTTAEIHIPVLADSSPGPDEHIVISFNHPTNATMGGFWGLGFGIITPAP